jgi:hypothetical protein
VGAAATHCVAPAPGSEPAGDEAAELAPGGAITATCPAVQATMPQDTVIAEGGASLGREGVAELVTPAAPPRASAPETTLLLPHADEKRFE